MKTMNKMRYMARAALIFSLALSITPLQAQDDPNVGKQAPELEVAGWATSKKVSQADLNGRPYVLEFWATWCPPCRKSIPHLNELSQRLEPFGLRVLGLSDEPLKKVEPFAKKMGMIYYVGAGHEMSGLEYRGIPFAAAVGTDGEVVWSGHPMDPAYEEIVWNLTRGYTPKNLHSALDKAQAGPLGPVYDELDQIGSDRAQAALDTIASNLQLRFKFAAPLEGLEKYKAMYDISALYKGVPGVEAAEDQMTRLLADPDIKKQVEQQKPMRELQNRLEKVQSKAMALQDEKSPEAAQKFYRRELVKALEEFVDKNPDHPQTPDMQRSLKQLKGEK